jgi:hypothetical protein
VTDKRFGGLAPEGLVRRTLIVVAVAVAVAIPAVALRAVCAGRSCDDRAAAAAPVPFCGLPKRLRSQLAAGYRDGRSPDVLAVTGRAPVVESGRSGDDAQAWPSLAAATEVRRASVAMWGTGVDESAPLPNGMTLDAVAPTLAKVIGLKRPHPEVRSGSPIPALAGHAKPRLAVVVVLHGVESGALREVIPPAVAGPVTADIGSLPADPAAVLTTVGTGGLPRQHGITGTLVRDDGGHLRRAWGSKAPVSVIATLADDLDEATSNDSRIGLVASYIGARGLIGDNWYLNGDDDDVRITPDVVEAATRLLGTGYGSDEIVDLLAVVIDEPHDRQRAAVGKLIDVARRSAGESLAVVAIGLETSEGPAHTPSVSAARIVDALQERFSADTVQAPAAGGLFLNQKALAEERTSEETVARALRDVRIRGRRVFADAFSGVAISFSRYC